MALVTIVTESLNGTELCETFYECRQTPCCFVYATASRYANEIVKNMTSNRFYSVQRKIDRTRWKKENEEKTYFEKKAKKADVKSIMYTLYTWFGR